MFQGAVRFHKVLDRENDRYLLMSDGWWKKKRYYGCVLHFEIRDGKIWFLHNGTEREIVDEWIAKGVPKDDIVLGFHAPNLRKYTEFAVG